MALKKIYSDLQYGFRKLSSGDLAILYDESAINQSLRTLFATKKGERIFNPDYGTIIPFLIFEPFDEVTAKRITNEIETAVRTWEGSRVEITDLKVDMDFDSAIYWVDMTYKIKSTVDIGNLLLQISKT